jgi:hypothetical protein
MDQQMSHAHTHNSFIIIISLLGCSAKIATKYILVGGHVLWKRLLKPKL